MTITNTLNIPRNQYTASANQTVFAIGFEFYQVADVKVYKNGTLLSYDATPTTSSTYSIAGTSNTSDEAYEFGAGGTVTLGAGASANDSIVIIRDLVVQRTQDFSASGAFDITALNTQLDTMTSMIAERETQSDRSIKLADTDTVSATLTLPDKATRASKMLEFDANGSVATTISTSGLQTLAANVSNINAVAGQITPTNNIGTLAGISSNITTLAGISNLSALANASSSVVTAASNITAINTVNTNITAIQNASTNANNAAASATAAQTAQAAAELAADNFDDTYLGAKSSDPTVDNDGNALTVGDLFFHSGTNNLRVYNGSAWEDAAISTNGFATTGLSIAMSVAL
tara:strand:+ start:134 stop:1177 length:1044 start_codon:yes stop_codon:yes gene_type:complete